MYGEKYKDMISSFPYQLPIDYLLSSGKIKGKEAYKQVKDLVRNMNYHLNHENFMKGYDLDINKFDI